MPMEAFYVRFPDIAFEEMRSVFARGMGELPDGQYGFLELYCNEPNCDCRRVTICVLEANTPEKIWATLSYGWEDVSFYSQWTSNPELARECAGVKLDPIGQQTKYSEALLKLFSQVLQDKAYVERLKRHYAMFRATVAKSTASGHPLTPTTTSRRGLSDAERKRRAADRKVNRKKNR